MDTGDLGDTDGEDVVILLAFGDDVWGDVGDGSEGFDSIDSREDFSCLIETLVSKVGDFTVLDSSGVCRLLFVCFPFKEDLELPDSGISESDDVEFAKFCHFSVMRKREKPINNQVHLLTRDLPLKLSREDFYYGDEQAKINH